MRQGELIGLRVGALTLTGNAPLLVVREQIQRIIDPATGKKVIHRQTPKGEDDESHERTIPLAAEAVIVLKAHLARLQLGRRTGGEPAALGADDLVFTTERGTPINDDNLRRAFSRACTRAGLPRVMTPTRKRCGLLRSCTDACSSTCHSYGLGRTFYAARQRRYALQPGRTFTCACAIRYRYFSTYVPCCQGG